MLFKVVFNIVRPGTIKCISELFTETYSKVFEYCAGCNAHNEVVIGDVPKFPLKNRVSEPLKEISVEQKSIFGTSDEAIIITKETEFGIVIDKLVTKGVSAIVIPEYSENYKKLLYLESMKNVMIFSVEEIFQIVKLKGFYFTSGLIAILYPSSDDDIAQQYVVIKNNLCGQKNTKVIHVIERSIFIPQAGKNLDELVDGPSLNASLVF